MTKEQQSISIKRDWIDKNKEEAFAMRKRFAAIAFNFGGDTVTENFYIIDEKTMQYFIKLLNAETELLEG